MRSSRTPVARRAKSAGWSASPRRRQSAASTGSSEPVVIRGYTAVLDHGLLAENIEAFIELRFAPGTQVADIDTAVTDLPELIESFTLAGDPDALVRVRVRDLEHLKSVVDQIRRGRRGGPKVLTTRTVIVLGRDSSARMRSEEASVSAWMQRPNGSALDSDGRGRTSTRDLTRSGLSPPVVRRASDE